MSVQIKTEEIVAKTEAMMENLDRMERETSRLHKIAADYNERIQDGVMGSMVDLLEEIGGTIKTIKEKTCEFTRSKQEGAEMLGEIMKKNLGKVSKI